jgi:hypothetical protein
MRDNLFADPLRRRLDLSGGRVPGVFASTAFQPACGADGHIVIARDLAAQTHAGKAFRREDVSLGDRNALGLAREEFDATGGATRVAAAGVELIDAGFLRQGQNKSFASGHFELAYSFDG